MPPLYRFVEVIVYSILNFFPFLILAIYPFRHNLRFSRKITGMLIGILTVIQFVLGSWAAFYSDGNSSLISAISTLLYIIFYFLAVKKHFGKTLFTLLMISNIANFAIVFAKCVEGFIFPEMAVQSYRWSFSLMLLLVEIAIAVPTFLYMKRVFTPAVELEPSGFEWKYLWLIPATFYVIWYYCFYGNLSMTGLQIALRPRNTLFLFIVNIGAFLIYYMISRLISEQKKTLELTESNHLLTMQTMQYATLQDRIAEARRAKHDVRHHIALMQEYINNGDLDALKDYLNRYRESLPEDNLIRYCKNTAADALLHYFAQYAKDYGIEYIVRADLPKDLAISDTDLSVLFGNLLENAVDACKEEDGEEKKILVTATLRGTSLYITVDNTYTGKLRRTADGSFLSTKHKGRGIGTRSVKEIAEQYDGMCRFEAKDGMFCASVVCVTQNPD